MVEGFAVYYKKVVFLYLIYTKLNSFTISYHIFLYDFFSCKTFIRVNFFLILS